MAKLHNDAKVLLGMGAVLVVPVALTLMTIQAPRPVITDLAANPTPRGYTWSLTLFIVPVIVLALWVSLRRQSLIQKRAFWLATTLISGSGILLDVCFGLSFFTFVNRAATLGATFWGYSFGQGWQKAIPIEEIGFYTLGTVAVLLAYVWGDEVWFGAYNRDDSPRRTTRLRDLFCFHLHSAIFGVVLFGLGLLYKKFGPHPWHEGFPGYLLFLTTVAIAPSIIFFPVANPFINWRAFSLAFLFMLLVSLFWEATIAIPYQWWGYQPRQMIGLLINGFCGLPLEASLLWLGITWATVIIYETIYTWLYAIDAQRPNPPPESLAPARRE